MVPVKEEYCGEFVAGDKEAVGDIIVGVRFALRNVFAMLPFAVATTPLICEEVAAPAAVCAAAVLTPEGVVLLDNCLVIGLRVNFVVVAAIIDEFVVDVVDVADVADVAEVLL